MTAQKPASEPSGRKSRSRFGLGYRLAVLLLIYLLSPGPVLYMREMVLLADKGDIFGTPPGSADSLLEPGDYFVPGWTSPPSADSTDAMIQTVYKPISILRQNSEAVDRFYSWYLRLFVPEWS